MKWIFIASLFSLSCLATLIENCVNVRLSDDGATVRQHGGIVIMSDDFSNPSDKWLSPHKTFEDFTWIHHAPTEGLSSLRIERNPKRKVPENRLFDTAWVIKSRTFSLPAGTIRVVMEIDAVSNNPEISNSCGMNYRNTLRWMPKNGTRYLREDSFNYNVNPERPRRTLLEFEAPAGADAICISLGADLPDLEPGQFVAFTGIKLTALLPDSAYMQKASFTTFPQRVCGQVTWEASVPLGTALKMLVSLSNEEELTIRPFRKERLDARPSVLQQPQWSAWEEIRQGQSPDELVKGAKWVRFMPEMSASESAAPKLTAINNGNNRLEHWLIGMDKTAPHVIRLSPSPTTDKFQPYIFTFDDETPIDWASFCIQIDGVDGVGRFSRDGDIVTVTPPKKGWNQGVHRITTSIMDIVGNSIMETHVFHVGESRKSNIVTMRDDGMTLIDGQPFFPIGMACAVKCDHNDNDFDKMFAMFEDAGMNFARWLSGMSLHASFAKEFMSAAEKHGIRLYIDAGHSTNERNVQKLAESVAFQIANPENTSNVVAWDTGNDTSASITPEQMRQRYNAIKAVDPWRIITQADGLGPFGASKYRPYVLYSDNFQPEIYPVHNDSTIDMDRVVPTVVKSMEIIKNDWQITRAPVRSCWPLIQYFYNCGGWRRLQSYEELRAMTYQAIIHGAHGVIWYRYAGYGENLKKGFTPEQWEVVTRVSKELHCLYDVLCERPCEVQPPDAEIIDGPDSDCLGNPSVCLLLKKRGDKGRALFAASSVRKAVKARIAIPDGATSIVDFFDGHERNADENGVFEDTFEPLGVHVYFLK